jgi:hypothetical protein
MYSLKMNGFEAYKMYLALKSHFSSKTYDYFKYNGSTRAKLETYEQRKDKYFFQKLAKKKDVMGFLVSLFVYGKKDLWIGDIVRNEEIEELVIKRQKVKESISYVFSNDLDRLHEDLKSNFEVVDGQHPYLLNLLIGDHIHIETFVILNDILKFVPYWNKHISDQVVWPDLRLKCKKYQPFMEYDKDKCFKILVDKFGLKGYPK